MFGALESVAVLWHLRSHRDIIISIIHVTGNYMAFSMEGEKLAVSGGTQLRSQTHRDDANLTPTVKLHVPYRPVVLLYRTLTVTTK